MTVSPWLAFPEFNKTLEGMTLLLWKQSLASNETIKSILDNCPISNNIRKGSILCVAIAMAHLTGSAINVEFFKEPPCLITLNEDLTIDRPIPWMTRKTCHVSSIGLLLFDLPAIGMTQARQRSIQRKMLLSVARRDPCPLWEGALTIGSIHSISAIGANWPLRSL